MEFDREMENLARFEKTFVGIVENPGMTYNIQESFNLEGYFNIKATPLRANLCLFEELVDGELEYLVKEAQDWVGQWFKEIRRSKPSDVDNERVTWLWCYGIPCHLWCSKLFQFLTSPAGTFICMDEDTKNHNKLDVARVMVRTKYNLVLNETFNIGVNREAFSIKIVEDSQGPLRIVMAKNMAKEEVEKR
ncbi:unnamed protein product [Vicia faba]|uniref:DUF4283 domain-containing protein n=1 Tax=Vicia faba TaxID=3906 RepID=A0AAV1ATX9_VICFA|nr:unnamed protein product [Vicia faba]